MGLSIFDSTWSSRLTSRPKPMIRPTDTAAVSLGRVIGFGRLVDIDDQVESQIDNPISTTHAGGNGR